MLISKLSKEHREEVEKMEKDFSDHLMKLNENEK
jgi:hypothetical protein